MLRRIALMVCTMLLAAMPAAAQEAKAEIGVLFGWAFADGVNGAAVNVPGVGTFDRIEPKDSFDWGLDFGVFVSPNAEIGFQFTQQPTTLEVGGTSTIDLGDMNTNTYHGTLTYNFGPGDSKVRPYLMFGLGATSYGDVTFTDVNGATSVISGLSRFSTTWGAGVKVNGDGHIGGRFGMRWTPTYIKSDASGWWCDPYWGCYVTSDAQYAHQFDFNAGITLRF